MSDVIVTINEFAENGAEEGLKAAIVVTMIRVRASAVRNAPVKYGELKNGIMWKKGWGNDVFSFPKEGGFNEFGGDKNAAVKIQDTTGLEGIVGNAVAHATYLEFGTRYMPAQPHMRIAADEVRGRSAAEIANTWGKEAMAREFAKRKTRRETR